MEVFKQPGLVPDLIKELPQTLAKVVYDSGSLAPGDVRKPTQLQKKPAVSWDADGGSFYTLVETDPDAPAHMTEVLHWLVVNIPGGDVSKGDEHVEYIAPGPPEGTGLHRYAFLVFKQKGKIEVTDMPRVSKTSTEGRLQFKIKDFVQKHDLGVAVAGNFMNSEYDDYVPILYKQIGMI